MSGRYFEGYHPVLESRLESHFSRVNSSFQANGFKGSIVLGGGYGRGEGGVMMGGPEPEFSNDLDYFLFDYSPYEMRLAAWCREIERVESLELGIDVEIKCLRPDSIGDPSRSMMFADLCAGHIVVAGDASFLQKLREGLDFSKIDPEEATRLLWNRGSGMFFSRCRMNHPSEMKFVIRNHAKLKLALGDGWLCLNGLYTSKCRERAENLLTCELPIGIPQLRQWHAEGVQFKFHPYATGPSWQELEQESHALIAAWGVMYLAAEEKRLRLSIPSFTAYHQIPRILRQGSYLKNLLLAFRDRVGRGGCIHPLGDYPRAGLMRALPCLLGLTPGGISQAANFLPAPAADTTQLVNWEAIYNKWWTHYA